MSHHDIFYYGGRNLISSRSLIWDQRWAPTISQRPRDNHFCLIRFALKLSWIVIGKLKNLSRITQIDKLVCVRVSKLELIHTWNFAFHFIQDRNVMLTNAIVLGIIGISFISNNSLLDILYTLLLLIKIATLRLFNLLKFIFKCIILKMILSILFHYELKVSFVCHLHF